MSGIHIRVLVAIGAWITATLFTAMAAVFLQGVVNLDGGLSMTVGGLVYLAGGRVLLGSAPAESFVEQLGIAIMVAGMLLWVIGIGVEFEEMAAAFLAALACYAGLLMVSRSTVIQFLSAVIVIVCYTLFVGEDLRSFARLLLALMTPAGLFLFATSARLAPSAIALLTAFPLAAAMTAFNWDAHAANIYGPKLLHIGLFIALATWYRRRDAEPLMDSRFIAVVLVATAVGLILPPGGSAAMLLLALAFISGSPLLASIGASLEVYFVLRYYYELDTTLLVKSILFTAVGVLLLLAWFALRDRGETR